MYMSFTGVQIQCNSCKTMAIPQYHLAMSDGSIRNFCSYNCVVSFQVSLVLTKFNCLYLSIFFGKDIYVFFFFFLHFTRWCWILHTFCFLMSYIGVNKTWLFFSPGAWFFTLSYSIQQNLFSKSPGVNSSVVPLTQGQVIMNANASTVTQAGSSTQSVVSATSTTSTSTVSSSSSNSAAAGLQRLAAQSQTQTQQQNNLSRLSVKLRCQHCSRLFATKPELLDYKV